MRRDSGGTPSKCQRQGGGGEESAGGLQVNKKMKQVVEYEGVSSRVPSPAVKINSSYSLQVVPMYAPPSRNNDGEVEEFFTDQESLQNHHG